MRRTGFGPDRAALTFSGLTHLHDALEKIAVTGCKKIPRDFAVVRVNVVAHAVCPDVIQ